MSYQTGQSLIAALLAKATGFSADNVSESNWKCLNTGKSDHYAILHCGVPERPEVATPTVVHINWKTVIELWQKYVDDTTTDTNLYTQMQNILDAIFPKPHLGGTHNEVDNSWIDEIKEPEEMWNKGGGPLWMRMQIIVGWHEDQTAIVNG